VSGVVAVRVTEVEADFLAGHASSLGRLLAGEGGALDAELRGHDLFEDRFLVGEVGVEGPEVTWADAARPSTPTPWKPLSLSVRPASRTIAALACALCSLEYLTPGPSSMSPDLLGHVRVALII
jgi:hypothetical protein